eukprot:SM000036S13269  [mRNA]  locus=s36:197986:209961:- [translate_table: standard]
MEKISVSIRVRPLSRPELAKGSPWHAEANTVALCTTAGAVVSGHSFSFDSVFEHDVKTLDIYKQDTKDIITSTVYGFNGTVFAYGQTSSGKTYTMRGTPEEPGIIPLAVHDVFSHIQEATTREFLLRVSYMEIYNEEINDLLAPENRKLQIHESLERGTFVAGLREEIVVTPEQVLEILESGEAHRHIGETNMNVYSSRSHSIFRMVIESRDKSMDDVDNTQKDRRVDAVRVSTLNLVDLAGSERIAKTGAEGARLKEGTHINKSLMTLGTVINKLSEGTERNGGHVPYRDSKLTRILQSALGGNAKTAIICNITPAAIHVDETRGTLLFASRAKKITNCAQVNEVLTDAALLKRQKREIEELRLKLQESHSPHLEEEILLLRNEMLKIELERERMVVELQEERAAQVEAERRIREQEQKIENLSTMVINSAIDDRNVDRAIVVKPGVLPADKRMNNLARWYVRVSVLPVESIVTGCHALLMSESSGSSEVTENQPAQMQKFDLKELTLTCALQMEKRSGIGKDLGDAQADFLRKRTCRTAHLPPTFESLVEGDKVPALKAIISRLSSPGVVPSLSSKGDEVPIAIPAEAHIQSKALAVTPKSSGRPVKMPLSDQARRHTKRQSLTPAYSSTRARWQLGTKTPKNDTATRTSSRKENVHPHLDRRTKSLGDSAQLISQLQAQVRNLETEKACMERELEHVTELASSQQKSAQEHVDELQVEMLELRKALAKSEGQYLAATGEASMTEVATEVGTVDMGHADQLEEQADIEQELVAERAYVVQMRDLMEQEIALLKDSLLQLSEELHLLEMTRKEEGELRDNAWQEIDLLNMHLKHWPSASDHHSALKDGPTITCRNSGPSLAELEERLRCSEADRDRLAKLAEGLAAQWESSAGNGLEAENQVEALQTELERIVDENGRLKNALLEATADLDELHCDVKKLKGLLAESDHVVSVKSTESADRQVALLKAEAHNEQLTKELKVLEVEKAKREEEHRELECALTGTISNLREELANMELQIGATSQELDTSIAKLEHVTHAKEEVDGQMLAGKALAEEIASKLEVCQQQHYHEVQLLRAELGGLRKEVAAAKALPAGLEKERDSQRKELEKLRGKLKDVDAKLKTALQDKSSLQTEKANIEREVKVLRGQSSLLQRDIDRRESTVDKRRESMAQGLNKAKSQLSSIEQALQYKCTELEKTCFDLQMLQEANKGLEASNMELEAARIDAESKLQTAESNLSTLREETGNLMLQLEKATRLQHDAEQGFAAAEKDLQEARQECVLMASKLQTFEKRCSEAERRILELEVVEKEMKQVTEELTEAHFKFEEDKAQMSSREQELGSELELVRSNVITANAECSKLKEQLRHAEVTVLYEQVKQESEELQRSITKEREHNTMESHKLAEAYELQKERFVSELEMMQENAKELTKQQALSTQSAEEAIQASKEKEELLLRREEHLSMMLQQSMAQLAVLQSADLEKEAKLAKLLAECKRLEETVDKLSKQTELLQLQYQGAVHEVRMQTSIIKQAEEAAASAELIFLEELETARSQLGKAEQQLQDAKLEAARMRDTMDISQAVKQSEQASRAEVVATKDTLRQAQRRLQEADAQIDELKEVAGEANAEVNKLRQKLREVESQEQMLRSTRTGLDTPGRRRLISQSEAQAKKNRILEERLAEAGLQLEEQGDVNDRLRKELDANESRHQELAIELTERNRMLLLRLRKAEEGLLYMRDRGARRLEKLHLEEQLAAGAAELAESHGQRRRAVAELEALQLQVGKLETSIKVQQGRSRSTGGSSETSGPFVLGRSSLEEEDGDDEHSKGEELNPHGARGDEAGMAQDRGDGDAPHRREARQELGRVLPAVDACGS